MKTYVINLAKNVKRLELIDKRLKELSVGYERIEAVYGKTVPVAEKRANSSWFWWWCIKGYPMRDGEYGCAMSHLNVYRKMVAENVSAACVLEDDAIPRIVLPKLLDLLEKVIDPNKPQVALISNHRDKDPQGEFELKAVSTGSFTDGYVVTLPAARKLLEKNFPIKCPSDTWSFWRQKGWIELYQVYPEAVNQEWDTTEGYTSDVTVVGDIVVDVRKMGAVGKVWWKAKRLFGMTIARLFLK